MNELCRSVGDVFTAACSWTVGWVAGNTIRRSGSRLHR